MMSLVAFALGGRINGQAKPNCPVQPVTLQAMRDCYRPVLVFAASAKDPLFLAQEKLLEQYADDMMDRNLLYVPVPVKSKGFVEPLDAPYVLLGKAEIDAIRSRFNVPEPEFSVLLIGKDGGEKFRTTKPISVLKLDALVDAMPMGRQEKSDRSRNAASH